MGRATASLRTPMMRGISRQAGLTMIELIIACAILMILSSAALPVARYTLIKRKEHDLKYNLRKIRDAIDYYKELADEGKFRTAVGTNNYPPDLETLVKGVQLGGANNQHKLRFLRKIPIDPMTGKADWGLRAAEDDPDSTNWSGKDVYDVYSKSTAQASDGTRYADW